MREIKFRARLVDGKATGAWVYGTYAKHIGHHVIFDENSGVRHIIDPTTLGQYTSLKDKNGVEIYEGDILDTPKWWAGDKELERELRESEGDAWVDGRCIVEWDYRAFGGFTGHGLAFHGTGEVIGNIYENSELING